MRKMKKAWILVAALLLLAPGRALALQAQAQETASKEFTAASSTDDGFMDFGVVVSAPGGGKFPDVHTKKHGNSVDVNPFDAAATLAMKSANAICNEAVDSNYSCSGSSGGTFCNDPPSIPTATDCCDDLASGILMHVTCQITIPQLGLGGFTIDRGANATRLDVTPFASGIRLNALNHSNTSGAKVSTDMLPRFCLRVDRSDPNAPDGNVDFSVRYFRPDLPPDPNGQRPVTSTFTVNTTGKDDVTLHQKIVDGFTALGLGLELGVMDSPGMKCEFDETFNGPLVSIWNVSGSGVVQIGIDGLKGQNIVAETNGTGEEGQIPTLSEWGLIFLAALLSVSALWMLRRRKQIGSAA